MLTPVHASRQRSHWQETGAERVDCALQQWLSDRARGAVVGFPSDGGRCYGAPGRTERRVLTCGP